MGDLNLNVEKIGSTWLLLNWTGSVISKPVVPLIRFILKYVCLIDDVVFAETPNTVLNVTELSPVTTYSVRVSAVFDAIYANNDTVEILGNVVEKLISTDALEGTLIMRKQ